MSQHELRNFQFKKGCKLVHTIECDWVEVRRAGNEMADEIGPVDLYCHNHILNRWEHMGRFEGQMRYTNLWGEKSIITPDFTGLEVEKKKKGGEGV